jgi:glycosyltransferase involved in cell wall biosynthesis
MSCEVPAIVSPVGMNLEVLELGKAGIAAQTQDAWYDAFEFYYKNREARISAGHLGRQIVLENYSQKVVTKKIASIFEELA